MLLLTFQTIASWNMHHDFGASSERRQTTVTVKLAEDGTATVTDEGSIRDHNLYREGRTKEDIKSWESAWSGSWIRNGQSLIISLQPTAERCALDTVPCQPGGANCTPTTAPCPTTPGAVILTCTRQDLEIEPATEGWVCLSEKGHPHTELPWLLVEGRCVSDVRGKFSGGGLSWCE